MIIPGDTFPYIGLRPFTEEDSLYFKGRDEQILQLTALLEANRFLMVTGASGDGKSSLVYAGLVPNARAGFFRARYANWVVADFRPERMPLHNLSKTLSKNLRIGHDESVEIELRRGFSSLVELYTSSSLYVDEGGEAWKNADANERDEMQRSAANLLLVTDQFEEFFTNPENYYRNAPSADSQLVINLLLETVRIAIERDLPVYIVCTMRSDYIGKCAAFRGLPEFIGFSQFFVPRLKRKEMVQVTREPAFLHGDKITDRLVERVVYDLGEGIDQLPVLEHAMNEVWIQAGQGKEELDLIHYAMAGGMAAQELPASDRKRFEEWFRNLPTKYQEAYLHPGLSQIIDTHANKLYLSSADHFNQRNKKQISSADAHLIIKVAFTCLTKMDEGKAVRNRMTLQEITDILSKPELTTDVVGGVLNIFREPGNTFLRPYISDDPETHELLPDTVLDITHESLIRNWDLLTQWAREEYEHLVVYEDFKKQLDRWLESNKSGGFLLSIGPLTYFESWHEKLRPSPYWINRYLDPGLPLEDRLREAHQVIDESENFLKKSAGQHRITRMVVRHGAAKLASIAAAVLMGALGIYFYLDAQKKENRNVIQKVLEGGESLIRNPQVIPANKAVFVALSEELRPGSFRKVMDAIPAGQRLSVVKEVYTEFAWNSNGSKLPLRRELLYYTDSLLEASTDGAGKNDKEGRLRALDILMNEISHYNYFFQDPAGQEILVRATGKLKELILDLLVTHPDDKFPDVRRIDDALEHLLNNKALSDTDIRNIVKNHSPFEGETARKRFSRNFPEGGRVNYARGNFFTHIAGYQQLAYLYGTLGDIRKVNSCIDSLSKKLPNYKTYVDGSMQIAAYLLIYDHLPQLNDYIGYYTAKQQITQAEFYERWLNNSGLYSMDFSNKLWIGENHNIVLEILDVAAVTKIADLYESSLRTSLKGDDLHFSLSLYFKQRGAILAKMAADHHAGITRSEINLLFSQAVEEYRSVSTEYKNEIITVFNQGQNEISMSRRNLFLYPDHFQKAYNKAFYVNQYYSPLFLDYLVEHQLIGEFYKDEKDLNLIYQWLKNYNFTNGSFDTTQEEKNYTTLTESDLLRIDSVFSSVVAIDKLRGMGNLVKLILIHHYADTEQYEKIESVYQKLDIDQFDSNLKEPGYEAILAGGVGSTNTFSVLMNELAEFLASQGRIYEVNRIIGKYTSINNRMKAYAGAVRGFKRFPVKNTESASVILDSAVSESRLMNYQYRSNDPRIMLAYGLSSVGGKKFYDLSETYVKQLSLNTQTNIIQRWIMGIAESGNYWEAYSSIPDISILTGRLNLYNLILLEEANRKVTDPEWKTYLKKRKAMFYQEDFQFEKNPI